MKKFKTLILFCLHLWMSISDWEQTDGGNEERAGAFVPESVGGRTIIHCTLIQWIVIYEKPMLNHVMELRQLFLRILSLSRHFLWIMWGLWHNLTVYPPFRSKLAHLYILQSLTATRHCEDDLTIRWHKFSLDSHPLSMCIQ